MVEVVVVEIYIYIFIVEIYIYIFKNGHILPTGQWYAPSAVFNDALIMQ